MTIKNFKNLGASPILDTIAPGEFPIENSNIPRQKQPYNFYLGSIETNDVFSPDDGYPIAFETTLQSSDQNLIKVSQIPSVGSIPAYTSFTLKKGHIYKLKACVLESTPVATDKFGWYKKEDAFPSFNRANIIGRTGRQSQIGSGFYVSPAEGFFDASKLSEDTDLVVAFVAVNGDQTLTNSYVEIFNVTNKSGPWD